MTSSSNDSLPRERVRREEAIAALSRVALGVDDLGTLLDTAVEAVCESLDAEYCEVLECIPGDDAGRLRAGVGWDRSLIGAATVPLVYDTESDSFAVAGPSVADGRREASDFAVTGEGGEREFDAGITAGVSVAGELWGVLGVHTTDQRAFDAEEVAFVERIVDILGDAIEARNERVAAVEHHRTSSEAFLSLDPEWRIVHANERAGSFFGRSAEALEGEVVWDVLPEAERSALGDRLREASDADEAATVEHYLDTPGKWGEFTVSPTEAGIAVCIRDVTDRKRRERERERFEALFAESRDISSILGPDGAFRYVPPSVANVLGYAPEELDGENAFDYVHPADRDRVRSEFATLAEGREGGDAIEYRFRHADGSWVVLESRGKNLLEDPAIEGIVIYSRDVTERATHERRLSTLIDNVPGMVYRCRNERGWPMEFVSDACESLTGYEPEALERGDVSYGEDVVVEAERDDLWESIQRDVTGEEPFSETYRIETADGAQRWVRDYGRGIFDGEGDLVALEGIISDITERKYLEAELEEVFGRVTDAFYALDSEWRFTHVNERAEELLQRSEEELLGEELWEAFPEASEEREVREAFHGAMESQEPRSYELYFDPLELWVEATVYPSETGVSVYFEDVTEQKQRQQELERKERRYEAVFEDPNILVGLLEPDGTVLDINRTAMEYVDADLEDVTGKPFWETPWWGEGDGVQSDVREWTERAADGEYVDFEADLTGPDGEPYTLSGYFRPVTDDDGEVVSIIVSDRDVTERKRRERELEESERRYRTLIDNFPNGAVALVGDDMRYRTVGGSPTDIAGATIEEIEGRPIEEVLPPGLRNQLTPYYEAALEGEAGSFETEVDGRVFRFQVVPVSDGDGEVFAALGMSQDVTERREYEKRLEESERRYRTLAEYFPNGLVTLFDEDLEYTLAAGQGFDYLQIDPEDVEGERFRTVWGEETADVLEPAFEAALKGEEHALELEYAGREWSFRAVPITDERGDVFAGMTVARDITERKERERYLEDAKAQLEAATEAGAVGTWEWDVQEDEFVVGTSFARTFGIDPKAAREGIPLGRVLTSIHDEDRERVERKIEEVLESGGEYEAEYRVHNVDGEVRWVVARGRVETDEAGNPVDFPGALTDITERKRAEIELERNKEQLETLFEILPVGIVVAEADGEMVEANDAAHRIWGGDVFDTDSVAEYDRYSVFRAESGERVPPDRMTLPRVLEGEEVLEPDVFEIEAADGERRVIEVRGRPIRNEEGEVVRGVATLADVTDQHEYRRRLEESERRYRTLVDHFPDGAVGLFNEDLEYTVVGGQLLEETDRSAEELLGNSVYEIYPEEFVEEIEPHFRAAIRGEPTTFEIEFRGRHLSAHTLPIHDGVGEVLAGMLVVQDVTEQREQERKLREREQRLQRYKEYTDDVLDAIDDVFYIIDENGDLRRWNESLESITGYEEVGSMNAIEFFDERYHERIVDAVRDGFETGQTQLEAALLTADGEEIPFEFVGSTLEDPAGRTVLAGIGRDITEREERRRRLEQSEQRYRTLAEHFPNGAVGVYDGDLRYTLAEGAKLGEDLPPAETLKGERMPDVFPEHVVADLEPVFRTAIEDGETASTETTFGGRHWQVWTAPLRNADGETFAGLSFAQDVTERIRRQERLEELVDRLEESNERLEQFAYAASHDLQEPLRMVSSYLQLIERRYGDELDGDAEEFLAYAVDGAERMSDMIEGLLKYSRVETRGDPFETVDLADVLEEVREDLQLRIRKSGAKIEAGELPTVHGDRGQLRQVFQNLLDNAIEYSGDDTPRIEITAERDGPKWVVSVHDNGIGIDRDDADRVFEVFQRLHTQDEHAGTGIGLSLAERIVERHDGEIWVESEPGTGSTFSFTLPTKDRENG